MAAACTRSLYDRESAGNSGSPEARIELKNFAYNLRRPVQLERHAMAGAP